MKVKAIKRGFDGVAVREAGEVFEFSGKLGKWMEKVGGAEKHEACEDPHALPVKHAEEQEPKAKAKGKH